jgi:uncharacterized protein (DUF952 family)
VIYHLLLGREWDERRGTEVVASPGPEQFVHCCEEPQLDRVRALFFPADERVVALRLDPTTLASETRYEPGSRGEAERFPHLYGPVTAKDVLEVIDVDREGG